VAVKLTPLQGLEGRIVLVGQREGWRVEEQNGDIALGEPVRISAGSYEARGRATTTRPGRGTGIALEVWIFALEDGALRAVRSGDGTFAA
jgi:ribosomal protein L27